MTTMQQSPVWREREEDVLRSAPDVGPVLTTTLFADLSRAGHLDAQRCRGARWGGSIAMIFSECPYNLLAVLTNVTLSPRALELLGYYLKGRSRISYRVELMCPPDDLIPLCAMQLSQKSFNLFPSRKDEEGDGLGTDALDDFEVHQRSGSEGRVSSSNSRTATSRSRTMALASCCSAVTQLR